jgi:hypothetical protein
MPLPRALGAHHHAGHQVHKDSQLLVVGFLGGGVRRSLLRVVRVPRKFMRCANAIALCQPSTAADALYRSWMAGKEMPARE